MASIADTAERFRIGRVFSTTFQAIFERWQSVGAFALIVGVVMAIISSFTTIPALAGYDPASPATALAMFSSPLYYLGAGLGIVSYVFVQAGSLYGFVNRGDGQDVSISDCFNAGIRHFLPLLGATILGVMGEMLGYVLLFVPALIIAAMWSVSGAALVAERLGPVECLGRSRALTKGIRWPIFGSLVIFLLVYLVIAFGVQGFRVNGMLSLYQSSPVLGAAISTTSSTIMGLLMNSYLAALYRETVLVKEGGRTSQLAEIFA